MMPASPPGREPVFNAPPIVVWLLVLLLGLHVVRQALSVATDEELLIALAFIPARYSDSTAVAEWPGGATALLTSFVSHALVHGNWGHLAFNSVWLLAMGGAVAPRLGVLRFLAFLAFCSTCGALAFLVSNPGLAQPMVGASGAIAGLMGATMRFLFSALDKGAMRRLRHEPRSVPLTPLLETLRDRRVLLATAIWLVLNGLAAVGVSLGDIEGGIAWEAHLGGYFAGLLSFGLFDVQMRNAKANESSVL